jgi:curved DNA-binding protein CbpA
LIKIPASSLSDFNKKPDLYALLELKHGATQQEIRYNYFKLMSKYRPNGVGVDDELKHSRLLN